MRRLGLLLVLVLAAVQPGVAADAGPAGCFVSCATALLCGRGATAPARLNATVTRRLRAFLTLGGRARCRFRKTHAPGKKAGSPPRPRPCRAVMLPRCLALRGTLFREALPRAKRSISTGVLRAGRVHFEALVFRRWRVVGVVVVAHRRRVTVRCKRRKASRFGRCRVVRAQVLGIS